MSGGPNRFCPACGTPNPASARSCVACRRPLGGREPDAVWARPAMAPAPAVGDPILLQETAALPGARSASYEPPPYRIPPQPYDPPPFGTYPTGPPPPGPSGRPPARRRGIGGCIMGLIAFGLICVVAAAFVGIVIVRPYVRGQVQDQVAQVVATQVVQRLNLHRSPTPVAGTYVIREADVNQELAANANQYDPIKSPHVTIGPEGLTLSFKLYGTTSTYTGQVGVANGRLVLQSMHASGPGSQILSARDVAAIIEQQLNSYVAGAGLQISTVRQTTGALTLTTVPAGTVVATQPAGAGQVAPPTRATAQPTRPGISLPPVQLGPTPTPKSEGSAS